MPPVPHADPRPSQLRPVPPVVAAPRRTVRRLTRRSPVMTVPFMPCALPPADAMLTHRRCNSGGTPRIHPVVEDSVSQPTVTWSTERGRIDRKPRGTADGRFHEGGTKRGDHRSVVGAEPRPGNSEGDTSGGTSFLKDHPQAGVRRNPAPQQQVVDALGPAGLDRFPAEHIHHRLLEGGRDVGVAIGSPCPLAQLDLAGDRGLQAGEREVEPMVLEVALPRSGPSGSRSTRRSPPAANRSRCGPPGKGSPRRRPTLSKASPAASSMVAPSA